MTTAEERSCFQVIYSRTFIFSFATHPWQALRLPCCTGVLSCSVFFFFHSSPVHLRIECDTAPLNWTLQMRILAQANSFLGRTACNNNWLRSALCTGRAVCCIFCFYKQSLSLPVCDLLFFSISSFSGFRSSSTLSTTNQATVALVTVATT